MSNFKALGQYCLKPARQLAWQLHHDCMRTDWRLQENCQTTAWWLPDNCLWLHDDWHEHCFHSNDDFTKNMIIYFLILGCFCRWSIWRRWFWAFNEIQMYHCWTKMSFDLFAKRWTCSGLTIPNVYGLFQVLYICFF